MKNFIENKYLNKKGKIKMMPRDEYDVFSKTIPKKACLFCEFDKYQNIVSEWDNWVLVQPVSPYFKNHTMLCSKRHISRFDELNLSEKEEFWDIDKKIHIAYKKADILFVRMQLHIRDKHYKSGEHLHIHYYEFEEDDFAFMVPYDAYLQNMKKTIGDYF